VLEFDLTCYEDSEARWNEDFEQIWKRLRFKK